MMQPLRRSEYGQQPQRVHEIEDCVSILRALDLVAQFVKVACDVNARPGG